MRPVLEKDRRGADRPFLLHLDPDAVQQMFADDLTLFSSALSLLLRDHARFCMPMTDLLDEPGTRHQLARHVHALRGSAGLLGATQVMQLAGKAETALELAWSSDAVSPILEQLTAAFCQLRDEAVTWLAGRIRQPSVCDADEDAAPHGSISTDELDELHTLLESRNLAALDKFSLLSPRLSELLGATGFAMFREAVDTMEFALAAQLLRQELLATARER